MGKRKKSQCENGELMIYCHYDKELVRCGDCLPCAECEPCAYCELDPLSLIHISEPTRH